MPGTVLQLGMNRYRQEIDTFTHNLYRKKVSISTQYRIKSIEYLLVFTLDLFIPTLLISFLAFVNEIHLNPARLRAFRGEQEGNRGGSNHPGNSAHDRGRRGWIHRNSARPARSYHSMGGASFGRLSPKVLQELVRGDTFLIRIDFRCRGYVRYISFTFCHIY